MKRAVVTVVMLASMTAFAGKRERDYLKTEIAPAVKAAETKFKNGCGCAIRITVQEASYKEVGDMHIVKSLAEDFGDGSEKYCTDEASKKAMCQMKSLDIAYTGDSGKVDFTFKAGKGLATTYANSRPGFDMITAVLDK